MHWSERQFEQHWAHWLQSLVRKWEQKWAHNSALRLEHRTRSLERHSGSRLEQHLEFQWVHWSQWWERQLEQHSGSRLEQHLEFQWVHWSAKQFEQHWAH